MSWLPAIMTGSKGKIEKEVAVISNSVRKINEDGKKMKQALMTLNHNVTLIDQSIAKIQAEDFAGPTKFIEKLDLPEEYKQQLVTELKGTKETALASLTPIKEASEKIRGNMAVSIIKYGMMANTLGIQKNIIESGTIQVEAIKKAEELGGLSADKITELVQQAEQINNMTQSAIEGWNIGTQKIKDTIGAGKDFDVFTVK